MSALLVLSKAGLSVHRELELLFAARGSSRAIPAAPLGQLPALGTRPSVPAGPGMQRMRCLGLPDIYNLKIRPWRHPEQFQPPTDPLFLQLHPLSPTSIPALKMGIIHRNPEPEPNMWKVSEEVRRDSSSSFPGRADLGFQEVFQHRSS